MTDPHRHTDPPKPGSKRPTGGAQAPAARVRCDACTGPVAAHHPGSSKVQPPVGRSRPALDCGCWCPGQGLLW